MPSFEFFLKNPTHVPQNKFSMKKYPTEIKAGNHMPRLTLVHRILNLVEFVALLLLIFTDFASRLVGRVQNERPYVPIQQDNWDNKRNVNIVNRRHDMAWEPNPIFALNKHLTTNRRKNVTECMPSWRNIFRIRVSSLQRLCSSNSKKVTFNGCVTASKVGCWNPDLSIINVLSGNMDSESMAFHWPVPWRLPCRYANLSRWKKTTWGTHPSHLKLGHEAKFPPAWLYFFTPQFHHFFSRKALYVYTVHVLQNVILGRIREYAHDIPWTAGKYMQR